MIMCRPALGFALAVLAALFLPASGRARAQSAQSPAPPAAAGQPLVPSKSAGAQPASPWPNLEEVIVVSQTHFDIGYTDLAGRVVDRYGRRWPIRISDRGTFDVTIQGMSPASLILRAESAGKP